MTNYIYAREYTTNNMSRRLISEGIRVTKELEILPNLKILAMRYENKSGYYYIVKNTGSQFDTSFVGDFEHLQQRYRGYTKGATEEEFLKLFKEVE